MDISKLNFCAKTLLVMAAVAVMAACAETPSSPTVMVMPGPGMPFQVFQEDNSYCRQYASTEISGAPSGANQVAGGAAVGAAVGAVAGTLLGDSRNAAGAGAATGALFGTAAGASSADRSSAGLQRQYNAAYEQCMYSKGNQVPGFSPRAYYPPPPPPR